MTIKKRYEDYIKFIVYFIVIILINLAGVTLFDRWDLTENKIFSLSEASKQVVSTLKEPLTIKIFFTKNLPAPHNSTKQYLHDLLEEYALYSNKNFNYTFYNVSPDENDITPKTRINRELAKNYGVYPVQIRNVEKDEVKFQNAYMGLVIIHGDMIEQIPTITSTDGLEYQLTMAIRKLNNKTSALLNIEDKIKIKLFLSSSLYAIAPHMRLQHLNTLPDELEKVIDKINNKSYGKIAFEYINPSDDENIKAEAEKYKIPSFKWPSIKSKNVTAGHGMAGLVMAYKANVISIPLINTVQVPLIGVQYSIAEIKEMEEVINENLESLIDINEDIGFLSDHGAETISSFSWGQRNQSGLSVFQTLTSQNYSIKNINLSEGSIPDSINCLVMIKPVEPFTDFELFQIDQFLLRGKSLALFLDPFNEIMPGRQQGFGMGQMPPQYIPINTGLEKLLRHYGVSVNNSYVLDENCFKQEMPQEYGGGQRPIYFAPVIKEQSINNNHLIMKNIKGIIAMKISPLFLDKDRVAQNGLLAEKLFSSSDKSWEMAEGINFDIRFSRPPKRPEEQRSFPLAYILEGKFSSFFEGKPIPDKIVADEDSKEAQIKKTNSAGQAKIKTEGDFISKGKPAKIFIMASTEMLKDQLLDPNGRDPNTVFIMNTLDFLNNREQIVAMRSKEQRFNPLRDTSAGVRTFVKSFNIIGLPILVVVFGLLVLFRRRSRKNRIQIMFNQQGT
ncbi:MAG: Gldg family protein [Deltaproteobacteria bacterium]|nr:Gldg family protein [Deltaproteobacteria bacterium]MBW1845657.1 Gldg family protein [Deltaproteobacteria bacterium]MBW1983588.1 Gldg family protein [Deltaproteobacteria bacterium]MBW2363846.1 Gldg family protein [Deltaproteobacteria bacterium]